MLGTILSSAQVPCDATLPSRATCTTLVVRCPGIEDLQATAAVTEPSASLKGTLFAHSGGGGTSYYTQNIASYLGAGLRVVQVKWASSWEQTQPSTTGLLASACRPATVLKWTFDNPHGQSRALAFCGVGHSGGSGVLAYALAHYGMGDYLDYAALTRPAFRPHRLRLRSADLFRPATGAVSRASRRLACAAALGIERMGAHYDLRKLIAAGGGRSALGGGQRRLGKRDVLVSADGGDVLGLCGEPQWHDRRCVFLFAGDYVAEERHLFYVMQW